jgi:hypothetical protein
MLGVNRSAPAWGFDERRYWAPSPGMTESKKKTSVFVIPRLDPLVSGTFFAFMMSEREFFPC